MPVRLREASPPRELERDGIVLREVHDQVSPKVGCRLSATGEALNVSVRA